MRLGKKQELFGMILLPRLLLKAAKLGNKYGYDVRPGDLFRDPRMHGEFGEKKGYGHRHSCHKLKLAIDLNIVKDGKLDAVGKYHKELGKWWEKQNMAFMCNLSNLSNNILKSITFLDVGSPNPIKQQYYWSLMGAKSSEIQNNE